jgi:hypothetical protein
VDALIVSCRALLYVVIDTILARQCSRAGKLGK